MTLRAVVLVLVTCACACGPSAEKREAQRMLAEIGRMRDTERAAREPLIAALEQQRAGSPDAELARARCTEAYRALQNSHRLLDEVKQQLESPKAGNELRLLQSLTDARVAVTKAKDKVPGCTAAVAALQRVAR